MSNDKIDKDRFGVSSVGWVSCRFSEIKYCSLVEKLECSLEKRLLFLERTGGSSKIEFVRKQRNSGECNRVQSHRANVPPQQPRLAQRAGWASADRCERANPASLSLPAWECQAICVSERTNTHMDSQRTKLLSVSSPSSGCVSVIDCVAKSSSPIHVNIKCATYRTNNARHFY